MMAAMLIPVISVAAAHSSPQSQSNGTANSAPPDAQVTDATDHQGPFSMGGQDYTLALHEKIVRDNSNPPRRTATVVSAEILDASGVVAHRETFPYSFVEGRFSQTVSVTASLLSANNGTMLIVRFLERTPGERHSGKESWQAFGVVDRHLRPFGAVLPLGQGSDIAQNGVVAGVMVKGGIAVVPFQGTGEKIQFRVWTGNFFAYVPLQVDWAHGQWAEAQQCYENSDGTLKQRGCPLDVEASREPASADAPAAVVRLFTDPDGDAYHSQDVPTNPDSHVEFLNALGAVHWQFLANRVTCVVDNVWLRVNVDGKEGWVRGDDSLSALGLPKASPR
jgi:hypothetical protein